MKVLRSTNYEKIPFVVYLLATKIKVIQIKKKVKNIGLVLHAKCNLNRSFHLVSSYVHTHTYYTHI